MNKEFTQKSVNDLLAFFTTSEKGLSSENVKERQKEGLNVFESKKLSIIKIFAQQYANFLMLLLAIGALISIFLGEWTDGVVILAVLVVNGLLGTFQEYKAEKLTEVLNAHIPQKVTVRRGGKETMIERKELVSGDIVILHSGQIAPADIRVVKSFGLVIDESALTGESVGVAKHAEALSMPPKGLHEMKNILFGGTVIVQGGGEGLVIAIGSATEFGKIISFTQRTKKRSSFLQQVNGLSDFLFKTTMFLMTILFLALLFFRSELGINHILLFTIALSIAIVPEMLPLISTIALTKASLALAKKGVLIKRLSALEDLGGVEIICTDKTGTITENVLKIVDIVASDKDECVRYGLLSSVEQTDPDHILAGSFDAAIWQHASEELKQNTKSLNKIWQGSFDPHFRWQFAVYKNKTQGEIAIKGAPESIVDRSTLDDGERKKILSHAIKLGGGEAYGYWQLPGKKFRSEKNTTSEQLSIWSILVSWLLKIQSKQQPQPHYSRQSI